MKQFFTFLIFIFTITFVHSQGQINFPGEGTYGSICPFGEDLVYLMVDDGMFYTSNDGGLNWTENNIGISEDFFDMVFFDEELGFAVGSNGTIVKTMDSGQNWSIVPSGTTENLFSIAMISLNNIWIVGHHGMVLHSTDGGNNWVMNNTLSSEQLNSIAFKDNRGYIAGNNGTLLQSNDYGNTWQPVSLSIIDDLFSLSMTESNTQLLVGEANEEYVAYFADEIYKTEDDSTWTNYYVPNFMDIGIANLYFLNDNVGYYLDAAAALCNCSHMNIFKTTDSGQTWSISYQASTYNSNSPFFSGFSDLIFVNDTIGYAYVSSKFFKTINGGSSWLSTSKKDFNFESFTIYPNPSHGNTINLEFSNPATSDFTFEISNISGKHVFSVERIENGPINISSLENGLYFVTILDDGKFIGSEKFIKSN